MGALPKSRVAGRLASIGAATRGREPGETDPPRVPMKPAGSATNPPRLRAAKADPAPRAGSAGQKQTLPAKWWPKPPAHTAMPGA
jgi:hypothetical protein